MRDYFNGNASDMRRCEKEKDFFADGINCTIDGIVDFTAKFVQGHQLLKTRLWDLFVHQFVACDDGRDGGWRGEYWGKMMRGACMTYSYTHDERLYEVLLGAVKGLIATQDEEGRISTYDKSTEFSGWDMWCRKYVLLGLQYFYDICKDDALKKELVTVCTKHLDYIISKVGEGENKIDIVATTASNKWCWGGLNTSSILEPVVKLYNLTNDKKYLDFASYVIKRGGSSWGNVFDLALKNEIAPYQYPVTKAYEMMSFFEGVIEYYRVTGDADCKKAFLNFINAVLDTDVTVIGCSGCTHELFDNSAAKQAEKSHSVMQETCVTVTLMKTCYQALRLTGDAKYADVIERAYYNALLSAVNFDEYGVIGLTFALEQDSEYSYSADFVKEIGGYTFDSYSPLVEEKRNRKIGGFRKMENFTSYGCCACIGSAGTALFPNTIACYRQDGIAITHYVNGWFVAKSPSGQDVKVVIETAYPYSSEVKITLTQKESESYTIALRIPSYSDGVVTLGGKEYLALANTYFESSEVHGKNTVITIRLDNSIKIHKIGKRACITKGAIVYALDERIQPLSLVATTSIISVKSVKNKLRCMDCMELTFSNGAKATFIDYTSSGREWDKDYKVSVWFDLEK